jgi:hypothetical protein
MMTPNYSMLLISNSWNEQKSFKLIPISKDAPYVECLYDPESKVMVIISTITKTSLHMLPKLDAEGFPSVILKGANAGKQKQERSEINVFYEYYVEDIKDMTEIINNLAVNSKEFDWKSLLNIEKKEIKKK